MKTTTTIKDGESTARFDYINDATFNAECELSAAQKARADASQGLDKAKEALAANEDNEELAKAVKLAEAELEETMGDESRCDVELYEAKIKAAEEYDNRS